MAARESGYTNDRLEGLLSLNWNKCFAKVLLIALFCITLNAMFSSGYSSLTLQSLQIVISSFGVVWLLPLFSLVPNRKGMFISSVNLFVIGLFCMWYLASCMLYSEQGWVLIWGQLLFCLKDPGFRPFIVSQVFSIQVTAFIFLFGASFAALLFISNKISTKICLFVSVVMISSLVINNKIEDMNRFLELLKKENNPLYTGDF